MNDIEILAPVGGQQQLIAAVRSGADAVYLGTQAFNARRNAENFDSAAGLRDAVAYCHARNVKVHVTMNTLVMDHELNMARETLRDIASAGVDAVIVQDLAVARLVRSCCPGLEMHASTQMAIHNAAGVRVMEKLGFSRVVLARELSLEEIRKIASSTSLEIETFVHGALCMSASGLCELSAMIGGRSGNRGLCAQPCRLDFSCRGRDHALSLKDMSFITKLPLLAEAGVCSAKIEGRMKRPEYVAAAVTACRSALAGEKVDMDTLQAVFSRSGFTDGYLQGKRDLDMFGYRTKDDVTALQSVLKPLAGLYRTERQSVPVDMRFVLREGAPASLTVNENSFPIKVSGTEPEKAVNVPLTPETARKNLGKTGGTQFYLRDFSAEMDDGLTLPVSELNRLRREALKKLNEHKSELIPKKFVAAPLSALPAHAQSEPKLRLRFETAAQVFDDGDAELIILPLREISANTGLISRFGPRLAAEMPVLCYPMQEEKQAADLSALRELGLIRVIAESIGSAVLAKGMGFIVHGGANLNILNSRALEEYRALGLTDATVSVELSMTNLRRLEGETPRGLITYGYLPLMKFRACPAQGKKGCRGCTGITPMTDRKNESFTVICRGRQYSELLNCVPLYIGDKPISGADFCTLYFTIESKSQCMEVCSLFKAHAAAPFRRTGGLYYRELL